MLLFFFLFFFKGFGVSEVCGRKCMALGIRVGGIVHM